MSDRRRRAGLSLLPRIAGADPEALVAPVDGFVPPLSDRSRYTVMGLAVCITALFSTCTIPVALTLSTGHFMSVFMLYGLLWGLFVFNLDRWVVGTVDYGPMDGSGRLTSAGQFGRKVALLVIRLAVSVLVGLSISEPLVMLIYNTEVMTEYHQVQLPALQHQTTVRVLHDPKYPQQYAYQLGVLTQANATVKQDTTLDDQANTALDQEENGTGGTHEIGVGPRSAERRADLDRADTALANARTAQANAQSAYDMAKQRADTQQQTDLKTELAALNTTPGLLQREDALGALGASSAPIRDAQWILRGLILLIDVAPLLLKLLSPRSPYERSQQRKVLHDMRIHDQVQANRIEEALADLRQGNAAAAQHRDLQARHNTLVLTQRYRAHDEKALREADIEIRRAIARHRDVVERAGLLTLLDLGIVPYIDPRARLEPDFALPRPGMPDGGPATNTSEDPDRESSQPSTDSMEEAISAGGGIDQLVDQRWRLGRQITGIGMRRGPRTPFLAHDIHDIQRPRRTYAVKCMGQDESARREIEALPYGDAISPYVTPVVHGGYDRLFGWFVVTPFYRNGTLQQLLSSEDQELNLGAALTITEQILTGLQAAYTEEHQFLAHFDIKPSNIAFDDDGNVRIIDWGLARASTPSEVTNSISDHPVGYTLWYAPAEQIDFTRGGNATWRGPLCDIRAIGAVLYTMITGYPPLIAEAGWLDLLERDRTLTKSGREKFINLLATAKPLPLLEFFAANDGWDTVPLSPLSELVEQWLDPDPAKRIVRATSAPTHDAALAALREVVANLRQNAVALLDNPVGAEALPEVPNRRPIAVPSAHTRHTARRDEQTVVPREKGF